MYLTIPTDEVIEQFLQEAASTMTEDRRQTGRYPFFRSVTIVSDDAAKTRVPAFIRNISRSGIGLLHNKPLETQRVTMSIPTLADRSINVKTDITWCKSCGEGWYTSGGPFIGLSALQAISLFSTLFSVEVNRRIHQRYPFFRPVTIKLHDAAETEFPAFMSDISSSGVGLLHNRQLDTHRVTLAVPTTEGRSVDIKTDITWCRSCGEGWYISGGPFTRIWAEKLPDLLM